MRLHHKCTHSSFAALHHNDAQEHQSMNKRLIMLRKSICDGSEDRMPGAGQVARYPIILSPDRLIGLRACPGSSLRFAEPSLGSSRVRLFASSPHSITPALSRGSSLAGFPLRSVTRNAGVYGSKSRWGEKTTQFLKPVVANLLYRSSSSTAEGSLCANVLRCSPKISQSP